MKNLIQQNWGKTSALVGVALFAALAGVPAVQRAMGQEGGKAKKEKKEHGEKMKGAELHGVASLGARVFAGSKMGLYEIVDGKPTRVESFEGHDIKALGALGEGAIWVATKKALYRFDGAEARRLYEGEVRSVSASVAGWLAVVKDHGVLRSQDEGQTWSPAGWELDAFGKGGKGDEEKAKGEKKHKGEKKEGEPKGA